MRLRDRRRAWAVEGQSPRTGGRHGAVRRPARRPGTDPRSTPPSQGQRYGLAPCCCLRCWPSWPAPPPTAASACSSACIASELNVNLRRPLPPRPSGQHVVSRLLHALDPAAIEARPFFRPSTPSILVTSPPRRDGRSSRSTEAGGDFDHLDDQAAAQVPQRLRPAEAALILAHQESRRRRRGRGGPGADPEQLGLRGVLFTADALHCQKNVRLRDRDRQRPAGATQAQPARPV